MRNGSSDISRPPRGSKLAALALLLACVCAFAVLANGAFGADLQGKIAHKQSQLSRVKNSQAGVSASIAEQNKQIDAIIGEVSRLQQQAAAARSELAAEQAKLDRAKARLAKERKHLQVVKARLKRALMVLRNQLVAIYKSDNPDTLSVVMSSASWSDVVSETDYLESIQNYGQAAASRAKELRNEVKAAVRRMRAARDQIQQARDAVAAKEKRIEASQAQAQAQHDQLISLRAARQSQLDKLLTAGPGCRRGWDHDRHAGRPAGPGRDGPAQLRRHRLAAGGRPRRGQVGDRGGQPDRQHSLYLGRRPRLVQLLGL